MKILPTLAITTAILAFSSSAFAETLNYNFTMSVTSIADGYGVFDELSEGGTINVSVLFDTENTGDGNAVISVAELGYVSTGSWASSWSDVQYNAGNDSWDAYSGICAGNLVVNGIEIHSGSVHQEVYLNFGALSSGENGILSGSMNIGVYNGSSAYLTAQYAGPSPTAGPPPTSVPELDPNSGMAALALVSGGLTIAWSRRRRQFEIVAN